MTESSSFFDSSFDYRSLLPSHSNDINDSPSGSSDEDSCLPQLSLRERLLGCGTCMLAGYLLSMGSFWRLKDLVVHHDPLPFVLNITIGNIIALAGSFFLSGPAAQASKMWHPCRRFATGLYVGSLFMTLLIAFSPRFFLQGVFLLLLVLCQYGSVAWYTLSYIPFAHDVVTSFFRRRILGNASS